jgi:aryl-alcohol dehydrogenase-like predicted oxidoreductase
MNPFGLGVLAALDTLAAEVGATPAQVALAWLAAQPAVAAPIASATSAAQVEELLGAMRLKLTAEQLAVLDRASNPRSASKSAS